MYLVMHAFIDLFICLLETCLPLGPDAYTVMVSSLYDHVCQSDYQRNLLLMCTSNSSIHSFEQDMIYMMTSSASKFAGQKGQGAVMSAVKCMAVANLKVMEPRWVDLQLCGLCIY